MEENKELLAELTLSLLIPQEYHRQIKDNAKRNKQSIIQYTADLICNSLKN